MQKVLTRELVIAEYIEKDVSVRQACDALGCCPTTLVKALKRYGITAKPRTWNHRRKNRFPQLQNKEWLAEQLKTRTMQDIAKELGTSSGNVSDFVKRHGLRWKGYDKAIAVSEGLKRAYPNGRNGAEASNWKGGFYKTAGGHIYEHAPDHPAANINGYVMQHRLVVEKRIGRLLRQGEVVHHINGIKTDNRDENLELMTVSEHRKEHMDAHRKLYECQKEVERLRTILSQRF